MQADVRIDCYIHVSPAGIDALVNDSLVGMSWSIQLPVSWSGADNLKPSHGVLML